MDAKEFALDIQGVGCRITIPKEICTNVCGAMQSTGMPLSEENLEQCMEVFLEVIAKTIITASEVPGFFDANMLSVALQVSLLEDSMLERVEKYKKIRYKSMLN